MKFSMKNVRVLPASLTGLVFAGSLLAHVGNHPSVHDTVASVFARMKRELNRAELTRLTSTKAESFLTPDERGVLGTEHLSFTVKVPVTVSVIRSTNFAAEPFWLKDREFQRSALSVKVADEVFDVWQKELPSGWVGFGVNSLRGGGQHHFLALAPKNAGEQIEIKDLYPGQIMLGILKVEEKPYVDRDEKFTSH